MALHPMEHSLNRRVFVVVRGGEAVKVIAYYCARRKVKSPVEICNVDPEGEGLGTFQD